MKKDFASVWVCLSISPSLCCRCVFWYHVYGGIFSLSVCVYFKQFVCVYICCLLSMRFWNHVYIFSLFVCALNVYFLCLPFWVVSNHVFKFSLCCLPICIFKPCVYFFLSFSLRCLCGYILCLSVSLCSQCVYSLYLCLSVCCSNVAVCMCLLYTLSLPLSANVCSPLSPFFSAT